MQHDSTCPAVAADIDDMGPCQCADALTDDDLETILIIARNKQSGRITEREVKLLVAAYRKSIT